MSDVAVGRPVPSLELPATGQKTVRLDDLRGRNVVLYFYPKDNTPGCTREGQDFRDHAADLEALDAVVFGVSRDSLKSHEAFREQQCFPFDLLADVDGKACELFSVIRPKNMYGKTVIGVERSTFLIDKQGVLRKEWRKVKVDGHVAAVLKALRALSDQPAAPAA